MSQIKKKWIGPKQVDGTKIQLENTQSIKSKLANATEVDLISINASDEVEILSAPRVGSLGTESNSLQALSQVQALIAPVQTDLDAAEQAIVDETNARIAADAAMQSQVNGILSGFSFKYGALLATADAGLAAAVEGDTLSALLPFSDDDAPALVIGDIAAGDMLLSKNGVNSKAFKVYDDGGTLKLTLTGFTQIADGDGFLVKYDLPDSPSTQETQAIYMYDGVDLFKIGDFDWSLADGIDVSPSYGALSGLHEIIVSGDSVQSALHKLESSQALSKADISALESDVAALQASSSGDVSALDARVTQNESDISALEAVDLVHDGLFSDIAAAQAVQDSAISANASTSSQNAVDITNLDARVTSAESDITTLTGDAVALESRVTTAESDIDALEISQAAQDSALSAIQGVNVTQTDDIAAIDTRLTTAESDIVALEAGVAALQAGERVFNKQAIVVSAQNITDGYVDLAYLVSPSSINASIDRVVIHEGAAEDFSVSTVSGVSRITFLNDLVAPSESALEAGDKMYINYAYKPSEQL